MNCYDFDKTIFNPDSSVLFTYYCILHHPVAMLHSLPPTIHYGIKYLFKKTDFSTLKEKMYVFLKYLDDVDEDVKRFWDKRSSRIEKWYLNQKRDDDIIISASPEFLLQPVADMLKVRLIATKIDKHTGIMDGKNCKGAEKVKRLRLEYPDAVVDDFYSDSLSDTPMAEIAKRAFIVNKSDLKPWPNK